MTTPLDEAMNERLGKHGFSVGQKVIAAKDLFDAATGDHPFLLYANKGEELIIRGAIFHDVEYFIRVSHEKVTDSYFCVGPNDISHHTTVSTESGRGDG